MAENNSTPQLSALNPSILADLHDLSIKPGTDVQQGGQNKGRSALYNKLYPNEKNPICPRKRVNYQPGEHFHYCPYAESGLCKDYAPPCRRHSLNGPAIPQGNKISSRQGVAQNQNVTERSKQLSPYRRQSAPCRNINVAKMLETVNQLTQGEQLCQVGCPNLNQRVSSSRVGNANRQSQPCSNSGSLGCKAEKQNNNMADGNRPPSGSPTPCSLAGAGCNRRRNQVACQNRKQRPRVWMPTNKPQKNNPFTLTDEQKALVLDSYYPGLIHDAVNQNADFNEIAKKFVTPETAVDGDKAEKGMSLIEAFDIRCKYEQINLTKLLGKNPEKANKTKKGAKPYKPVYGPLAHPVVSDIVLEDNVRASAIPIDLQHYVRTTPENDPIRAIACLTRAQQLNDYYKEYKAAQAAANLASPSKIEEAALQGVKSFMINSLSAETKTVDTGFYKSLELVSYIGVTKPD